MNFIKLIFALVASAAVTLTAAAQQVPSYRLLPALTNGATITVTNGVTTLAGPTNQSFLLPRGSRGFAFTSKFATSNASTAMLSFYFNVSTDGTNWTTLPAAIANFPHTGTTGVLGYTNFPGSLVDNGIYVRLGSISNAHTATTWITNAWISSFAN